MKKFICLFLFSFLLSGLFAKDFIIHDYYSDSNQIVYLTRVKNDDQYSVMVFKNQGKDLYCIISFKNCKAYEKAKDCFENIEVFIEEHEVDLFRGTISNSNIYSETFKITIKYDRPWMYNDFQKQFS